MEAKATLRYARISPRKVGIVCDLIRGKSVAQATAILRSSADMDQARTRLEHALPELETIAAQEIARQGWDYPVSARLERTEFPFKAYDGFALPAGEYTALRVVIGEGKGQNWWCVVFPPLCTTAATDRAETAISAGWEQDDLDLVTEENTGYVLKFRSVELWETIRRWLGK
jgi:stage II sporulation protein R